MSRLYNLFFLVLFSGALLGVMVTNYLVDPANLFRNGFEYQAAGQLVKGEVLKEVGDIDDRLLKRYYVEQLTESPDVVALGTSRSYPVGEVLFDDSSFVNLALTGSTFEDINGMYGVLRQHDRLPKLVVLEVIPWIFNDNAVRDRWRSLGDVAVQWNQRFLEGLDSGKSVQLQKLGQLVSIAYFRESIRFLKKGGDQSKRVKGSGNAYLPDLTIVFADYNFTDEEYTAFLDKKALAGLKKNSWSFRNFRKMSETRRAAFLALLDQMDQDGVQVVFYMPPFYHTSWKGLSQQERFQPVLQTRDWFRQVAADREIPLYGDFDQAEVSCPDREFFDPIHPRRECVNRLLAPLSQAW